MSIDINSPEFIAALPALAKKANEAAKAASEDHVSKWGHGAYCGFAWVVIDVKGNTKLGRAVRKLPGFAKHWSSGYYDWNPGGVATQSMDVVEAGARAAAKVYREAGLPAYAGSRAD